MDYALSALNPRSPANATWACLMIGSRLVPFRRPSSIKWRLSPINLMPPLMAEFSGPTGRLAREKMASLVAVGRSFVTREDRIDWLEEMRPPALDDGVRGQGLAPVLEGGSDGRGAGARSGDPGAGHISTLRTRVHQTGRSPNFSPEAMINSKEPLLRRMAIKGAMGSFLLRPSGATGIAHPEACIEFSLMLDDGAVRDVVVVALVVDAKAANPVGAEATLPMRETMGRGWCLVPRRPVARSLRLAETPPK